MTGISLSIWLLPKITTDNYQIQGICKPIDVISLKFEPVCCPLLWHIQRFRILQHDTLLISFDTLAEILQNLIKIIYSFKLNDLQSTLDCFKSALENFLPFLQREFHQIHFFALNLHPKDIKYHVTKLHIALVIGKGDNFVHSEWNHL